MANTDFVWRATPHPQMVSPLQRQIVEEPQAKEDPMEDEIEGLDAKVLLNANPLEEGEQAAVDLEELQTAHPPTPVLDRHNQGLLCHQLPEEDGIGVV